MKHTRRNAIVVVDTLLLILCTRETGDCTAISPTYTPAKITNLNELNGEVVDSHMWEDRHCRVGGEAEWARNSIEREVAGPRANDDENLAVRENEQLGQ